MEVSGRGWKFCVGAVFDGGRPGFLVLEIDGAKLDGGLMEFEELDRVTGFENPTLRPDVVAEQFDCMWPAIRFNGLVVRVARANKINRLSRWTRIAECVHSEFAEKSRYEHEGGVLERPAMETMFVFEFPGVSDIPNNIGGG